MDSDQRLIQATALTGELRGKTYAIPVTPGEAIPRRIDFWRSRQSHNVTFHSFPEPERYTHLLMRLTLGDTHVWVLIPEEDWHHDQFVGILNATVMLLTGGCKPGQDGELVLGRQSW